MAIGRDYSRNGALVTDNPGMGREMQEIAKGGKGMGNQKM